ncbi:photosystem I assembly BtpA [candidate division MSBL1 archaeon SCGC-AAA261G05]|uniref:Photosystem I assembly BtpA n=2 Tax=candidate division MSBL1 TaxID=215777 RepID=A0A133VBK1_9EURY|nr:photosystem I assembly BtpA [candidate division MSBL1 archaeon SCGC-AAA261G05]
MYGKRLDSLEDLFGVNKPIIGMIHLLPMPGAPGCDHDVDLILEKALEDAEKLEDGGVDGLIVENMWDIPYFVGSDIPPETIAIQSVAARKVVEKVDIPVGANVIHNAGRGDLAVALASGAKFMRICLFTGAQVWDTGEFDHGVAAELTRLRRYFNAEDIRIFADIDKKHAKVFPGIDLRTHAIWSEYYLADALIVTGEMTGRPPKIDDVKTVKEATNRPVLMGSGMDKDNVSEFLKYADGAIVGTSLKEDGVTENPVDLGRVKEFMKTVEKIRAS